MMLLECGDDMIAVDAGLMFPEEDMLALEQLGVGKLFGPGTPTEAAIGYIRDWFAAREHA